MNPLTDEQIEGLNPGIRSTVLKLRGWGFDTVDSGDGVTRDYECDLPHPYVHIRVSARDLFYEMGRLTGFLRDEGVVFESPPDPQTDLEGFMKHPNVEASFLPLQDPFHAFIHLSNVILP